LTTAIINQLKTGSISNVIQKGDPISNPGNPYVVVWAAAPIPQAGNDNMGKREYMVSVHFPPGYSNDIDDYMDEAFLLLDGQRLTTRDLRKVTLTGTLYISSLIEGNNDGTISKERNFVSAGMQ